MRGSVAFLRVTATVVMAAFAAGCQAAAPTMAPTDEPVMDGRTSSLCPPVGGPIGEAVTARAIEVLESRLAYLGVHGATFTPGTCIDVELADEAPDPAVVAVALQGTGQVAVLAVPADRIGAVVAGGPAPPDAEILAASGDFMGAASETGVSGQPDLLLQLTSSAAAGVGTWAAANADGAMALVVDGIVVAVEPVDGSIADDRLRFELPPAVALPVRAIEAMVASGPLPDEWAQPQDPQG